MGISEGKQKKWRFVPKSFLYVSGNTAQLGSIKTPEGLFFAAVEPWCGLNDEPSMALVERVLKVLNRELPDGKPRKRKVK